VYIVALASRRYWNAFTDQFVFGFSDVANAAALLDPTKRKLM